MKKALYKHIASKLIAIENCNQRIGRDEFAEFWKDKHEEQLSEIISDYMPSGSGIDAGTLLDESSRPNRLVFLTSYHHTTNGMYDGWSDYKVIVTPSLFSGFDLRITGRDRDDIKEYLYQVFYDTLNQEVEL